MADKKTTDFMDMFRQFGENMNLPTPDINSLVDYHSKNIAAVQAATQAMSSSAQDMMNLQRQQLETALQEIAEMVQEAQKSGMSGDMMTRQIELARKSFDKTVQNAAELAEVAKKGNTESFNILKDRVEESINELSAKKG